MSLIGQQSVFVPSQLIVKKLKNYILLSGRFGKSKLNCNFGIQLAKKGQEIKIRALNLKKSTQSRWGTFRQNLENLSYGLTHNYKLKLELIGIGYKLRKKNTKVILNIGFSHQVFMEIPFSHFTIKKTKKRPATFLIQAPNYELLHNILSFLRSLKEPEIYKGKGFRLNNEILTLKEGKKTKNN